LLDEEQGEEACGLIKAGFLYVLALPLHKYQQQSRLKREINNIPTSLPLAIN
jgi:hypothetical protein